MALEKKAGVTYAQPTSRRQVSFEPGVKKPRLMPFSGAFEFCSGHENRCNPSAWPKAAVVNQLVKDTGCRTA